MQTVSSVHISSLCVREHYYQREHLQFPYFMKLGEGILMFKVLACFPADVQHCLLLMETILPMTLLNFPIKMENLSVFFIPKSCFLGGVSAIYIKNIVHFSAVQLAALTTKAG